MINLEEFFEPRINTNTSVSTVPSTLFPSRLDGNENFDDNRSCWVCFATDEDGIDSPWVKPCNCRGTTKWVHQACLQRWVDEKQRGNPLTKVCCPQCNTEYIIVFPHMGPIVMFLDTIDTIIYKVCPFMAAGILVGSIYWTAVTYGAVTVMQVVGYDEGLAIMANAQTLVLVVGLPSIPVMLIFGKMVRWEETVLFFLRRYSPKVPILKYILPSFIYHEEIEQQRNTGPPSLVDTICATKVLCSALLLPTIATIVGGFLFDSIPSRVQRTLLGGITFIAVKGLLRIYHKQQKYIQKNKRIILDYTPENIMRTRRGGHAAMSSRNRANASSQPSQNQVASSSTSSSSPSSPSNDSTSSESTSAYSSPTSNNNNTL